MENTDLSQQTIKYQQEKIMNMPIPVVKDLLRGLIIDLHRDCGQKIDKDETKYLLGRIYDVLTTRYKQWRWFEVMRTFERGGMEEFGTWRKVTVKLLFSWLYTSENNRRVALTTKIEEQEKQFKHTKINPSIASRYVRMIRDNLARTENGGMWQENLSQFEKQRNGKLR